MSDSSSRPQLDYAPPPSRVSRLRRFVLPLVLIAITAVLVRVAPRYWTTFETYLAYRNCAAYTAPATQVVFEEALPNTLPSSPTTRGTFPATRNQGFVPEVWSKFYASVSPGFISEGTAFLHERETPSGVRILVGVDYLAGAFDYKRTARFFVRTFSAAGPNRLPVQRVRQKWTEQNLGLDDSGLRLYAGQPDPADPTHFTIAFSENGEPGIIDGWVADDQSVLLELRKLTTQPAPSPG